MAAFSLRQVVSTFLFGNKHLTLKSHACVSFFPCVVWPAAGSSKIVPKSVNVDANNTQDDTHSYIAVLGMCFLAFLLWYRRVCRAVPPGRLVI